MKNQPEDFIGKILFFPRGHTFFRVESVKRYSEEEMGGAVFLHFTHEKIEEYIQLAKQREDANDAMHDIAMDIVTYAHKRSLDDQFPF